MAQGPCTTGTNPSTSEDTCSCSLSGEVANEPVLIDCRDGEFYEPYETGCRVSLGATTIDVQRTEMSQPYNSSGVCRTALMDVGYTCTHTAESEIYTITEHRVCAAQVFKLGGGLESTCEDTYVRGRFEERYTDGCTTKMTTPVARLTCTHDPGVRLAYFFDVTREPALDDEVDRPTCGRGQAAVLRASSPASARTDQGSR